MAYLLSSSFSRGHLAYLHDVRINKQDKNVDTNLIKYDEVIIDKLENCKGHAFNEKIRDYTNKKMQPYVDEYNSKQPRKDRQISSYCDDFEKKQGKRALTGQPTQELAQEFVVQIGNHESIGKEYYDAVYSGDTKKMNELHFLFTDYYTEVINELQKKYPHFDIIVASIHFDEPNGTPHLHITGQFVGEGYKKGLSHQVSISKALANDGFERMEVRREDFQMKRWYAQVQSELMPQIAKNYDIEIVNDGHSKGRGHIDSKFFPSEIKQAEEELADLREKKGVLTDNIEMLTDAYNRTAEATSSKVDELRKVKEAVNLAYDELDEVARTTNATIQMAVGNKKREIKENHRSEYDFDL